MPEQKPPDLMASLKSSLGLSPIEDDPGRETLMKLHEAHARISELEIENTRLKELAHDMAIHLPCTCGRFDGWVTGDTEHHKNCTVRLTDQIETNG